MAPRLAGRLLAAACLAALAGLPAQASEPSAAARQLRTIVPTEQQAAKGLDVDLRVLGARDVKARKPQRDIGPVPPGGADDLTGTVAVGSTVAFDIKVNRPARVYVLDLSADGEMRLIFPNRFEDDNVIEGKGTIRLPGKGKRYEFKVGEPLGIDTVKVIAVEGEHSPLDDLIWGQFDKQDNFPKSIKPVEATVDTLANFFKGNGSLSWAEANVELEIVQR
jgi:hypothetical protein